MGPTNPFLDLTREEEPETEELTLSDLLGEKVVEVGPPMPLGTESPGLNWPRSEGEGEGVSVVGLHGGAGATTVAHLIGDDLARDAGPAIPRRGPALFVCRSNGVGFERARGIARSWAAHELDGVTVLGLVIVAGLPKLPKELRGQGKQVSRMLPRCWHLDWRTDWHLAAEANVDALDMRGRRTRTDLRRQCEKALTGGSMA